ncbi:MAG: Delta-aminolevulinic acid dehydratase [bacterium]|nr:Delta-aminolevulinic acid dehydratase [bacterium]
MMDSLVFQRLRRLRATPASRSLVRETRLHRGDFILPLFVVPGARVRKEVPSMPGVFNLSVDQAVEEARQIRDAGIPAVILFGIPEEKNATATGAFVEHGIVQRAASALKQATPDLVVIADTCLCEYTNHGHCGILEGETVANDPTLEVLGRTAVSQARAGADWIAPSGMMDGMVAAIRAALDDAGFKHTPILSYAAKYASGFYGPFRDAAQSTPAFGDRRTHQMDPANRREALREIEEDLAEGADAVMVKPALAYLDIIREARDRFDAPLAAYQVSGEYSMIKAAGRNGWIDERRVALETLVSIKRAGADMILTYFALEACGWEEVG